MTYEGHVENGVIVLDSAVALEEGTRVRIEVTSKPNGKKRPTLAERLGSVIGMADGLPEDFAENHDEYLRRSIMGEPFDT